MARIQLIKSQSLNKNLLTDRWYLPINLIWLATYLKRRGHELEILDGTLLSSKTLYEKIGADIVGIDFNIFSAKEFNEISKIAKEKGSIVVTGGQAATHLYKQILLKNPYVDIIVRYDGEEAINQIAIKYESNNDIFQGTPNIAYRTINDIQENPLLFVPIDNVPIPERNVNGIEIEEYINLFSLTNTSKSICGKRVTNTHTKKGCPRKCSFCARTHKLHQSRSPEQTYLEYKKLESEYAIDYIFDHSDTWAYDINWLKDYHKIYISNGGLKVRQCIFADLRDLTNQSVKILETIGIDRVMVGLESISDLILLRNNKDLSSVSLLRTIEQLEKANIKIDASFILGLIGENYETLENTIKKVNSIRMQFSNFDCYYNIILPLPGSQLWHEFLIDPVMNSKYSNEYIFDIDELRFDYLKAHCNLGKNPLDYLLKLRNSLLDKSNHQKHEYIR